MQKQPVDRLTVQNSVSITNIESLAQGYILNCRCEGKSPKTITIYQQILKTFLWFCNQNHYPTQPKSINADHIREFLWYLSNKTNRWGSNNPATKKPASKTTVSDYHRSLRTFFKWLEREQLITENPFNHLKIPKTASKIIQALTTNEVKQLFKTCSGKNAFETRNKAIISILLDCGLRISELAGLTLRDVSLTNGTLLVRKGKGGKQRTVRIGTQAQKALWRYVSIYRKGQSNRLFLNRIGEPLDVVGMTILIKRLGDKAKIKVHPHKLRHTFAISFYGLVVMLSVFSTYLAIAHFR